MCTGVCQHGILYAVLAIQVSEDQSASAVQEKAAQQETVAEAGEVSVSETGEIKSGNTSDTGTASKNSRSTTLVSAAVPVFGSAPWGTLRCWMGVRPLEPIASAA